MNSRKSGHLLPFTLISVQLIKSRGASFLVDQVSTITSFQQIYESLNKTIAASCVMELAERFSLEEVENRPLFELTVETLRRIARMEDF